MQHTNKTTAAITVKNSHPSIDPKEFTQALALAANSVNIVTTDGDGGKAGLTVSSMCSVCAEPPVVLVCVSQTNVFCTNILKNNVFAVNLLSNQQQAISNVFAGHGDDPTRDRFSYGQWTTLKTDSPILADAMVSLDCELTSTHRHGTHNIYIGRVVAVARDPAKAALVYCNREYAKTTLLDAS